MPEPHDSCMIELGGWFDVNWADYPEICGP